MQQKVKQTLPVLLIIGVTVFMSLLLYRNVIAQEKADCWQLLQDSAQSVTREMNIVFENDVSTMRLAANTMMLAEGELGDRFEELDLSIFRDNTLFSRIDLLLPDGTVRLEGGGIADFPEGVIFGELAQNGEHMSTRMTDSQTGEETMYYMIPLTRNGKTEAILAGVLPSVTIKEAFRPSIYKGKAVCCLIDSRDGNFVMDQWHDTLSNILEMEERTRAKGYEGVDLKRANLELQTGVIAFRSQTTGKILYMYYMPIGMFDWELEVFVPENAVFESMNYLRQQLLIAGGVEVLLLLAYFLWNLRTLRKMTTYQRELQFMSYWDGLTAMYNRNKYIQLLEKSAGQRLLAVGVAFLDLNGLKHVNDCQGHEAGDALISGAAEVIRSIFRQNTYRVGGDEFVIVSVGLPEKNFQEKIDRLERAMVGEQISISLGAVWASGCDDLEALLKEADTRMYQKKEEYYAKIGQKR